MLKYSIEEKVGEGAYGEVFRARRKENGQTVAIKKLFLTESDEGVSYSALQEIKYLGQLKDAPLVIDLIETFFEKDQETKKDYLTMVLPYYQNDLNGALTAFQKIEHIKCGFKQILEGVAQMHALHLMHRDLKPANLLVQDGNISIADLGMMANFKSATNFPSNVVTLWYRSPELLLGQEKYGPEVDIWSCGILFIELMTRKSPFPGKSEMDQLHLTMKIMGMNYMKHSEGLDKLPLYPKMMMDAKTRFPEHSQIRQVFKAWPLDAVDLLEKMLCPSSCRLSAAQLLEHPFFQNEPKPCLPSQIPKVEPLHEYEMKRDRERKRKMEEKMQYQQSQQQSFGKKPCFGSDPRHYNNNNGNCYPNSHHHHNHHPSAGEIHPTFGSVPPSQQNSHNNYRPDPKHYHSKSSANPMGRPSNSHRINPV